MDKKYIYQEREYVRKSRYYTFDVDGTGRYRFPTFILNTKTIGAGPINLKKEMRPARISENEANFISDLENKILASGTVKEKPIRQFPILIENRELWSKCCKVSKVTDGSIYNRMYFKADLFFPAYSLIVEVDSNLHNPEYDKARDLYLGKVGNLRIKTLRCSPYMIWDGINKVYSGRNTKRLQEIYDELEFLEQCCVGSREYPRLDFLDYGVRFMRDQNKVEFCVIDEMLESSQFTVNTAELKDKGIRPTKILKENISRLTFDIYGKEVEFKSR